MKNFIFISPNFPHNYENFVRELKNNGLNVLGIGDCPYENLSLTLKQNLGEYYKVDSLENYDQVYRGVAYFAFKYGKPDYLESNNEYWLEKDAQLRDDFNITSGFHTCDMAQVKYKSKMKKAYHQASIKTARYVLYDNRQQALDFIEKVGYPIIAKPDNGVGANDTYKINSLEQLDDFIKNKPDEIYILEEFIDGTITSYDAIINSQGEPLFETGNVTPLSLLEVVNGLMDCTFYIRKDLPQEITKAGRACVKAFNIRSRYIHLEFFTLNCDQAIGKKGEVVALEVNMRPSGGVSPDMMNYANKVSVYKIYADMIAYDSTQIGAHDREYCAFFGRRDAIKHFYSKQEVLEKYASCLKKQERVEPALSGAMADEMFIACFDTIEQLDEYYQFLGKI